MSNVFTRSINSSIGGPVIRPEDLERQSHRQDLAPAYLSLRSGPVNPLRSMRDLGNADPELRSCHQVQP